jgi:RNA polymerase sigma factor (sigma-70 family)
LAFADHVRGGMPACGLPWTSTSEVAVAQRRLARQVAGAFGRKLSFEDCLDVAAETIGEVERFARGGVSIGHLDALLWQAARRNALDLVRRRQGEARTGPRPSTLSLESCLGSLTDPSGERDHTELLDTADRRQAYEDVAEAMGRLSFEQRTALCLRHIDGLAVDDCAATLAMSRTRFERLHTRAMKALRDELAAGARDHSCHLTRRLLAAPSLTPVQVAHRDAHLDGCLPCRAYAQQLRALAA